MLVWLYTAVEAANNAAFDSMHLTKNVESQDTKKMEGNVGWLGEEEELTFQDRGHAGQHEWENQIVPNGRTANEHDDGYEELNVKIEEEEERDEWGASKQEDGGEEGGRECSPGEEVHEVRDQIEKEPVRWTVGFRVGLASEKEGSSVLHTDKERGQHTERDTHTESGPREAASQGDTADDVAMLTGKREPELQSTCARESVCARARANTISEKETSQIITAKFLSLHTAMKN